MVKNTYLYKSFERFWHWSQAILILFLAMTGFEIHGTCSIFGWEKAIFLHNTAAWSFIILTVFAIFWHFVTGEWRQYIPTFKLVGAQVKYYLSGIFKGEHHPTNKTAETKFNPIQRLTYLGLHFVLIPAAIISGLLYYYYDPAVGTGVGSIALLHTLIAFLLITFVIAHVYLATTGHTVTAAVKGMLTGWEDLEVEDK